MCTANGYDLFGPRGGGRQDHRGCCGREVLPVMLADAVDIEVDLIGEFDFLKEIAQPLRGADGLAGCGVGGGFREGVNAEFHP